MTREVLLSQLPRYEGKRELITGQQSVRGIISEILNSHKLFREHYEKIALYFDDKSSLRVCDNLYLFCKRKIRYRMEGEASQTVKSPAAIIAQGYGDCKHYASFCGGVLDAINRLTGKKIDWHYRFASYDWYNREPGHVFIVVMIKGKEHWIDPTPGAEDATPVFQINKRPNMALYRISGVENYGASELLDQYVSEQQIYDAIQVLLKYGIMNVQGKVIPETVQKLQGRVSQDELYRIVEAYNIVRGAAIGGFFGTIWRGIKKVTLFGPRAAYLSLVAINAFGYATKLYNAVYNADGSYTSFKDKLKKLWQDRLGGDWTKLENTIRNGHNKKAILGAAAAAAIPAWVTVAGACITAIMPLVNAFLKSKQSQTTIDYNIDPTTGQPYGAGMPPVAQPSGPIEWVKQNPLVVAGAAVAIVYFMKNKKS